VQEIFIYRPIGVDGIKANVVKEFPVKVQNKIASVYTSKQFQDGAKLLKYGGINGIVAANIENGLSKEAACAKTSGAIEQTYRTFKRKWEDTIANK